MTKQEFIKAIADAVVKYKDQFGICVASPIIAQAILESGWGTSKKAKYNNYFGLKYRKNRVTCNNGYFEDGGSEQNSDGTYTLLPSNTAWYAFDSIDDGVLGYFQFIDVGLYSNLKGVTDPYEYLKRIKADGYATSINYVDNVYNVIKQNGLTKYDNKVKEESVMSNSNLVNCKVMSPNHSGKRTHSIDRITPHCVVGQLSAQSIGGCFTSSSRQASCNYGIGTEGDVCLVVDEENRSWCSSSNANDQRAVTIECASDKSEPYAMNSKVYNKLVELCFDICKRNGKTKLIWFGDKNKSLAYEPKSNEMVLTVHRWFANKSCPGDWLYSRLGELANTVTSRLGGSSAPAQPSKPSTSNTKFPNTPFTVQVLVSDLNIRKQPTMGNNVVGQTGKGSFTITEVNDGFGKLKSGAGWIYLENPSYVTIKGTVASSTPAQTTNSAYTVKVTATALNVRKGPGTNYGIATTVRQNEVYTIVDTNGRWGKLKSGAGWICLDYTKRC